VNMMCACPINGSPKKKTHPRLSFRVLCSLSLRRMWLFVVSPAENRRVYVYNRDIVYSPMRRDQEMLIMASRKKKHVPVGTEATKDVWSASRDVDMHLL
jgi:hypothetical protein